MSGLFDRHGFWWRAGGPAVLSMLLLPPLKPLPNSAGSRTPLAVLLDQLHALYRPLIPKGWIEMHFVYSENALQAGRFWTVLSHCFLHLDYPHLLNNCLSLVLTGRRSFAAYGSGGYLVLLLGGSVAAALNHRTRHLQLRAQINSVVPSVPQDWGPLSVVNAWSQSATNSAAHYFRPLVRYVGCSAGVMALLAVELAGLTEELVTNLVHHRAVSGATIMDAVQILTMLGSDVMMLRAGELTGVDHAGHIDGFLFGCAALVVVRGGGWLRRRRFFLRRVGGAGGVGRRLGGGGGGGGGAGNSQNTRRGPWPAPTQLTSSPRCALPRYPCHPHRQTLLALPGPQLVRPNTTTIAATKGGGGGTGAGSLARCDVLWCRLLWDRPVAAAL